MAYIFLDESGDLGFDFSKKIQIILFTKYFTFAQIKPLSTILLSAKRSNNHFQGKNATAQENKLFS